MKFISVILLTLGLAFVCCRKEEEKGFKSDVDLRQLLYFQDGYYCTATKEVPGLGHIDWTANALAYIHRDTTKFGLIFSTYQDTAFGVGSTRETLQLDDFEFRTGTQEISLGSYARSLADGDLADALWRLDESSNKTVTIDEINRAEKYVKGHFSVKFKMVTQGKAAQYSEHINFRDAVFKAKLME